MAEFKEADPLRRLVEIMAILRSPGGCPWDAVQTTQSLKPYLLEETYEVLEAIDHGEPEAICDELGDLLLQIVFHSRIFEERGHFDIRDVASAIVEKLIRRHPHVFGESGARDLDELSAQWERIKAGEKKGPSKGESPLDGISPALPALVRARKMAQKAEQAGLTKAQTPETFSHIRESIDILETVSGKSDSLGVESALGHLLFLLADLGRSQHVDAEDALRRATENFRCRFSQTSPSDTCDKRGE